MDFSEKASIRIQHWIGHNEHHAEEYGRFARDLEGAGYPAAARHVREMMELTRKSTEMLRKALSVMGNGGRDGRGPTDPA